jgi:hypothetical protein
LGNVIERNEIVLANALVTARHVGYFLAPGRSKWSKDRNITWLQSMGSVWRQAQDDNLVVFSILAELIWEMGDVTIKNEKPVGAIGLGNSLTLKVTPEPFKRKHGVCPSTGWMTNAA